MVMGTALEKKRILFENYKRVIIDLFTFICHQH